MARQKPQVRSVSQKRPHRKLTHEQKLARISQYQTVKDPFNKSAVTKQYKKLKSFPLELQKPGTKRQREGLKKRGFFVTQKGVIVDGPRDARRKPVKARRFKVLGEGEGVKWTVNGRRDYIIGLTPDERKQFAANPVAFLRAHREMMKEKYPDFRKARDIQVRLQWGAYQATRDFAPSMFVKGDTLGKEQKLMKHGKSDKLTGLHYTIHLPRSKRAKRKHAKRKHK